MEVTPEYLQAIITHQAGKILSLESVCQGLSKENTELKAQLEPPPEQPSNVQGLKLPA